MPMLNPTVAIQGDIGSFSEEAALKLFQGNVEILSCQHFEDVFREVKREAVDYCLIPIENSLSGSIHRNYDLLRKHNLYIVREIYLKIEHNLIVLPGVALENLTTVLSHPVALNQCERFFEDHPQLKAETSWDTSGSVRELLDRKLTSWGAIASRRASEAFDAQIILENIQDSDQNYTRFVLLSRKEELAQNANKTSVVYSFKNVPGALFKSLSVFALRDIDLTKIESRPIRGRAWEYLFYLDFLGSLTEERVKNALNHLQEITATFEVLGCYPRDESVVKKGL
jgi:prephenate dehydratase